MTIVLYLLTSVCLFFLMPVYFWLANRFQIFDEPNERSSHKTVTIRGGGIVFPMAIILWFCLFGLQLPYLTVGVVIIAVISFLDDIFDLNPTTRLVVHLIAVSLVLLQLDFFIFNWFWLIPAFIVFIGWLNAFNFMDGINGITAFYSFSVLVPIWYLNYQGIALFPDSLLYVLGISILVFAFFNARKKAKTFAGDVGSVSMALVLGYLVFSLILKTEKWEYILFVSVYGVDTVLTIIYRLFRKENIFKPHRSHFYQVLANDKGLSHISISTGYGVVQILISFFSILIINHEYSGHWSIMVLLLLTVTYVFGKPIRLMLSKE